MHSFSSALFFLFIRVYGNEIHGIIDWDIPYILLYLLRDSFLLALLDFIILKKTKNRIYRKYTYLKEPFNYSHMGGIDL